MRSDREAGRPVNAPRGLAAADRAIQPKSVSNRRQRNRLPVILDKFLHLRDSCGPPLDRTACLPVDSFNVAYPEDRAVAAANAAKQHPASPGRVRLTGHREKALRQRNHDLTVERCWSWSRLLTFFAAAGIWYPLNDALELAAVGCGLLLALFCVSVAFHRRARTRREFGDRLLIMVDESLGRCGGKVTLVRSLARPGDAPDPAAQLEPILEDPARWTLTDQEREDLDIHTPPVGLFGLLNRTSTEPGARRLRDLVDHPTLDIQRILARQQAVKWLDEHTPERLGMMAAVAAFRTKQGTLDKLAAAIQKAVPLPSPIPIGVLKAWSALSGLFTLVAIGQVGLGRYGWGTAFLVLLLINAMLYLRMRRTLDTAVQPWRDLGPTVAAYLEAARRPAEDLPDDAELAVLRECFRAVVRREVLPALYRPLPWADTGGMFHALLNALVFYDLHVAQAILKRAVPHKGSLIAGLSALADLEALLSLACFAWESGTGGETCYPRPVSDPRLAIEAGCHPLIEPAIIVPNDVDLAADTHIWVITGSNMSGKSTLLRMVGVNVLLAQLGTVALARAMTWTPMRLMTDLRANDNLAAEESYFLAEVRHIRRMVLPPDGTAPILGLIDEPFRGTNSEEQVAAGLAVTQHLLESSGFFLIATHERRLTELAEGQAAQNHHFREDLEGESLVFDYHLHPGPAITRNALRVLEREGYPSTVLSRARHWLRQPQDLPQTPDPPGRRNKS